MNAPGSVRCSVIAGALLAAAPVGAITNGVPDGNAHPMVGGLFADFDGNGTISGDELLCSGSFAGRSKDGSADVFLTAAHCIEFGPDIGITQWYVSFDNAVLDADGPTGLIASIDFAWDPAFFFRVSDGRDFGVVLLPAGSVTGIQPVILPAAGALDALRQGAALKRIEAESVGYGVTATFNQPGGVQFDSDGLRRRVDTRLKGLTQAYAKYNENSNATGGGGTCFGDSGSPQFIKGTRNVLSVTFFGDPLCRATESNTRLDTPAARAFLGQYLNLP
jgi:hypothetical protein